MMAARCNARRSARRRSRRPSARPTIISIAAIWRNSWGTAVPAKRLHIGHKLADLMQKGERVVARFENEASVEADLLIGGKREVEILGRPADAPAPHPFTAGPRVRQVSAHRFVA